MQPREKGDSPKITTKRKKYPINRTGILFVLIILALAGFFFYVRPTPEKPFQDFIATIRLRGFTPNIGMSSLYMPGAVLRTKATAPDGTEIDLSPPIFFAWNDDCFPDLKYRESPYLLPRIEASNMSSFTLGMDSVGLLLPALNLTNSAVSDYTIRLKDCRIVSIAEPDIARRFSETCVENIKDALRDGKKLEWFSVITDVIAAKSFSFEIRWMGNSSVQSRLDLQELVQNALSGAAGSRAGGASPLPFKAKVELKSEGTQKTVFSGTGNLVLGYKAHILKAVRENE